MNQSQRLGLFLAIGMCVCLQYSSLTLITRGGTGSSDSRWGGDDDDDDDSFLGYQVDGIKVGEHATTISIKNETNDPSTKTKQGFISSKLRRVTPIHISGDEQHTRYMQTHYELVRCTGPASKSSRQHKVSISPRIVAVDKCLESAHDYLDTAHYLKGSHNNKYVELSTNSIPSDTPIINESWYEPNALEFSAGKAYNTKECKPMHKWQTQSFPFCNSFHEISHQSLKVINVGGERIAFEGQYQLHNANRNFVYKTLKYSKDSYHDDRARRKVEEQQVDSLILERASSSKFIPNIYGYCGLASLMDYMPEGNMHDYIKGVRLAGESTLLPLDKLKIAIHITSGVADLHSTSFFHNDLCCHQFLMQDGIFKLNDYNMAKPIYRNITRNAAHEKCTWGTFESERYTWKGRSFEELQKLVSYPNYQDPTPEMIDVWMIGNLIFIIMTNEYTFEIEKPHLNMRDVAKKLLAGERSPIPKDIKSSSDPSYIAMKTALDMCWTQNWRKRPPAQEVSTYLMKKLQEITGEDDPDVRVTLPERDPRQGGSDSDFKKANCDHDKNGKVLHNCN